MKTKQLYEPGNIGIQFQKRQCVLYFTWIEFNDNYKARNRILEGILQMRIYIQPLLASHDGS